MDFKCDDYDGLLIQISEKIFTKVDNNISINYDELMKWLKTDLVSTWLLIQSKYHRITNPIDQQQIENICITVLSDFAKNRHEFNNFIAFLSNINVYDEKIEKNGQIFTDVLTTLLQSNTDVCNDVSQIYLSVLCRNADTNTTIIDTIGGYFYERWSIFDVEKIILNLIGQRRHFLEIFATDENDIDLPNNEDQSIISKLLLCRLLFLIRHNWKDRENTTLLLELTQKIDNILNCMNSEHLSPEIQKYATEIGRQNYILHTILSNDFLSPKITQFTSFRDLSRFENILDLATIDVNFLKCPEVKEAIKQYKNFTAKLYDNQNLLCYDELNEFIQFQIIAEYLDIIFEEPGSLAYEVIVAEKLEAIKKNFRLIESIHDTVFLLENIFALLFHRSDPTQKSSFVCSKFVIEKILSSLKMVATQKRHSDAFHESDDNLKSRFLKIMNVVNDGVWRFSLFEQNEIRPSQRFGFVVDASSANYLIPYDGTGGGGCSSEKRLPSSSDDDGTMSRSNEKHKSNRRRPRKRRSLQKSDSDKTNPISITTNTSSEKDLTIMVRDESHPQLKHSNSMIVKMMGSADTLATYCINRGEYEIAKQIIKMYNLESTTIAQDINLSDNHRQIKQKLTEIFKKYDNRESNNSSSKSPTTHDSTIQIIKNVAAIGLEATKITNIIENFIARHRIEHSREVADLLEKHKVNHPYLSHYTGDQIQATYICDLMLSLATSYETGLILFNLINKHFDREGNLTGEKKRDGPSCGSGIIGGHFKFVKNLMENLNLYKIYREMGRGVIDILCDEVYPIEPSALKKKLKVEQFLQTVEEMSDQHCMSSEDILERLNQIEWNVNLFARVIQFYENGCRVLSHLSPHLSRLSIDEVLKLDFIEIIGEIIFEKNVPPKCIESVVADMNMSVVSIIVKNCLEEIQLDGRIQKDDFEKLIICLEGGETIQFINSGDMGQKKNYKLIEGDIFEYLHEKNPLVSFVLKEIFQLTPTTFEMTTFDDRYFSKLIKLESIDNLRCMFDGNVRITALNYDRINFTRIAQMIVTTNDHMLIYKIISSLKERQLFNDRDRWNRVRDLVIMNLIKSDWREVTTTEKITDLRSRSKFLLTFIEKIDESEIAERIAKGILSHDLRNDLEHDLIIRIEDTLKNIEIYRAIGEQFTLSWSQILEMSTKNPEKITDRLLYKSCYDLCLAWSKIHRLTSFPTKYSNFLGIFATTLQASTVFEPKIFEIIERLPPNLVIKFYKKILGQLHKYDLLTYIVEYLMVNDEPRSSDYQRFQISLCIFQNLQETNETEINEMWMLFSRPLLIIEQYLMNSKFDLLTRIIGEIRPLLRDGECRSCMKHTNLTSPPYYLDRSDDFMHINIDHAGAIKNECVDVLLRCYAAKSLDFRITDGTSSSQDPLLSQSTDQLSVDSLYGIFILPKTPPARDNWVRDEDALHCMCCKRAQFTILTRRHHCRRCGRVVCHSCSTNRRVIPDMYGNIKVRFCNDCFKQSHDGEIESLNGSDDSQSGGRFDRTMYGSVESAPWKLYGNLKHDNIVREEFCYEYAPSVPLCLAILAGHSQTLELSYFLLYQCRKFENLLRPIQPGYANPEIDYVLVTRMLHYLALAAKVRNGPPECATVIDHAEIILSIVQNGCEALLPMEPLDGTVLRKLRDKLMFIEKWNLALELSTKCGYPKTGVMAAWGISCLRAGCYETAKEKFAYCLTRVSPDDHNKKVIALIATNQPTPSIPRDLEKIRRPTKSPPLLSEILKILEVNCQSIPLNILSRADMIKNSNASMSQHQMHRSTQSSKKLENIPPSEPALNILHTLENLSQITRGNYDNFSTTNSNNPKFYEETLYYLLAYGTHTDIVAFLIRRGDIYAALKYLIGQQVDPEIFIAEIYLPHLRSGNIETIINCMIEFDETLLLWRNFIIQTCRYLEQKSLLNSLYQLQLLLKDPVRASMTCVRFYSMNCTYFGELLTHTHYLKSAQAHLQAELELLQWEEIKVGEGTTTSGGGIGGGQQQQRNEAEDEGQKSILMKMDSKTLNNHINTILRQIEATKFLAKCETEGKNVIRILTNIFQDGGAPIPTLFDGAHEKIKVCVVILICGRNIEEGFGLAYRIIQDFNLNSVKIYGITARYLSGNDRIAEVEKLIDCIKSNSADNFDKANCNELITLSIQTAVDKYGTQIKASVDNLLNLITNDVGTKINCHIICGQLKKAYLLAVQSNRINDIKKIKRQAELLNQGYIVKLCEKKMSTGNLMTRSQ